MTWGHADFGGDSAAVRDSAKGCAADSSHKFCLCCNSGRWIRRLPGVMQTLAVIARQFEISSRACSRFRPHLGHPWPLGPLLRFWKIRKLLLLWVILILEEYVNLVSSGLHSRNGKKHRKRKYGAHDIVQVPIDDAERKDASDRGSAYYCKNCLLKIQYRAKNRTTCKSILKQYQKAHRVRWGKQIWWKNLQARRPKHTEAFLRAVGWTKAEVDQLWNVTATE